MATAKQAIGIDPGLFSWLIFNGSMSPEGNEQYSDIDGGREHLTGLRESEPRWNVN